MFRDYALANMSRLEFVTGCKKLENNKDYSGQ
jgi:hypothetical protein